MLNFLQIVEAMGQCTYCARKAPFSLRTLIADELGGLRGEMCYFARQAGLLLAEVVLCL